jgi:hypothetical protein
VTIAVSAGPCDSPAVTSSSAMGRSYARRRPCTLGTRDPAPTGGGELQMSRSTTAEQRSAGRARG